MPNRAGLPPELNVAMSRMLLVQPQAAAFHVKMMFSAVSDTGQQSEGTFTEDWLNESWWRQIAVVNGKTLETRNINGKIVRKQDEGFLLPFAARHILDNALDPFPDHPTKKPVTVPPMQVGNMVLRCSTIGAGTNPSIGMPAEQKNFCVDPQGDLRLVADPLYRLIYNQITAFGARSVALDVRMLRQGQRVAELRVLELRQLAEGIEAIKDASSDEQIEFALSQQHPVVELTPRQMQHQMISTDVAMIPAPIDFPLKRGQLFAVVRVLQQHGRLLDAEILNCSNPATRALAIRVLKHVSFSEHAWRDRPLTLEGVVTLVVPQR